MQPTTYSFAPRRPKPAANAPTQDRPRGQNRPPGQETRPRRQRPEDFQRPESRRDRSEEAANGLSRTGSMYPLAPRGDRSHDAARSSDATRPRNAGHPRDAARQLDAARSRVERRSEAPTSRSFQQPARLPERDARPASRSGRHAPQGGPSTFEASRSTRPASRAPSQVGRSVSQPVRRGPSVPPSSPVAQPTVPAPHVRFREVPPSVALTSFAELKLRPETRAAVDAMGISVPTPIQSQAIPVMLAGEDVVGQARTGSGKTLAFSLPLVERCDPTARGVQALVLVPTRELAIQVGDVIEKLARARRLKLTLLYGGRSLIPEARALAGGAQIVVGTPGRTLDHLRQGNLHLDTVKIFVLDEGDEMLDRGFAPDVERILARTPNTRQTALFSATVPPWVMQTAARHLHAPLLVQVDTHEAPPEIEHVVYDVDPNTRSRALRTLLDRRGDGPIIVFGRTKHGVKKLARQLEAEGFPVVALQGNLSQKARERAMTDFRSGAMPILVATNVAARGIDVADVGQVINYEVPESAELFTHRVGRTGRMGKSGEAITFVTPEESQKWRQIERALGKSLPRRPWLQDGATGATADTSAAPQATAPAPTPSLAPAGGRGARDTGASQPQRRPRRRSRSGPYGQRPAR